MSARPQPLIAVSDVERSSRWYQHVLACQSGHGGDEYERLEFDGELVLQLHAFDEDHHHAAIGDPNLRPYGNGVLLWFEIEDFDEAADRAREMATELVEDVHVNPNSGYREIWIRDLDGYSVVLSSPDRDERSDPR